METSAFKWSVFAKLEDIEALQKSRKAIARLQYDVLAHDEVIDAAIVDFKATVDEWVSKLIHQRETADRSSPADPA